MLHKSQKASLSLSLLSKNGTWARCGDDKSFLELAARKIWWWRHRKKKWSYSTTALASSRYRVILSFLQPVQGLARPTTKGSKGTLFRIFKTMCTCKEMQAWGGMHAHNASKMGLSNDSGIGMENCEPQSKTPPESGRRTHLLYFTYSYCILSRVLSLFACFTSLWTFISISSLILHVTSSRYCSYFLKIHHFHYTFTHAHM